MTAAGTLPAGILQRTRPSEDGPGANRPNLLRPPAGERMMVAHVFD
jgi:hypothetical protein